MPCFALKFPLATGSLSNGDLRPQDACFLDGYVFVPGLGGQIMCRYAMSGPYKEKYACFSCRKVFRQPPQSDIVAKVRLDTIGNRLAKCPECGEPMHNMGLDFHTPRQTNRKQWRKVEILHSRGIGFGGCGCGPGLRPATLRETPAFLHQIDLAQQQSERQRIKQLRAKPKKI